MEYELYQSQKENREWQDRNRIMQIETQMLDGRIAKSEIGALQHERIPDLSVYDTCKLKYQETDKSRILKEDLKENLSYNKRCRMRHRKRYVQIKKTINEEINIDKNT